MRKLGAALAAVVVWMVALAVPAHAAVSPGQVMLDLTNDLRDSLDLDPLAWHQGVADVAQDWAEHMLAEDDYRHNPDYFTQLPQANLMLGSENIAWVRGAGSATAAAEFMVELWIDSPGHYANMTEWKITHGGMGFAYDASRDLAYGVQNFARYANDGILGGRITLPEGSPAAWYQAISVVVTGGRFKQTIDVDAEGYFGGVYVPAGTYTVEYRVGSYVDGTGATVHPPLAGEWEDDARLASDATPVVVEEGEWTALWPELSSTELVLTDIAANPFRGEIRWLASTGMTTGWKTGDGTAVFRPLSNVNRDQMAAFLYRMAGSPEFDDPAVPTFADVPTGHVFFTEIEWLATQGITNGWTVDGGTYFRPATAVNRDVMAAFLYRFAGSPGFDAPAVSPFTDVSTAHVFYKEIAWLADAGISQGWTVSGGKQFRPTAAVKRDVMAAFLYRFAQLPV